MGYCCSKDQHMQQLSLNSIACKEPSFENEVNKEENDEHFKKYLFKQIMDNTDNNDISKHSLKDKIEKYFSGNNIKIYEETNNGVNNGRSDDNENNMNIHTQHNIQNIDNIPHHSKNNPLIIEYSYIFKGDYPLYLISNPKHNNN